MESHLPIYIKSSSLKCLIVGGGAVAARKTNMLISHGILPHIIAPEICELMQQHVHTHKLTYIKRYYRDGDSMGFSMVIAATNNKVLNEEISRSCSQNCLINDTSNPLNSNFILPAIVNHGSIKIAISTLGKLPYLAKKLAQKIELNLNPNIESKILVAEEKRKEILRECEGDKRLKQLRMINELTPLIDAITKSALLTE